MILALWTTAGEVPIDLSREEARDAARRELADPAYSRDEPGLLEHALIWLDRELRELLANAAEATPGGWRGLAVLAAIVIVMVLVVRYRIGPVARRAARTDDALFGPPGRTAADHRRAAAAAADRGDWAEAVRERLRAIIRDLEERYLLEARVGRTADEAAVEAGRALPDLSTELLLAARTFDDVWYGGRSATAAMDAFLVDLDRRVARARPAELPEASR